MLFQEIFKGIRKTWLLSVIAIIQIAIGMTLSTVAMINDNDVYMKSRNYKSLVDDSKQYFEVTDHLYGEAEDAFFTDELASNRIKAYIEALEKSETYPYYHYGNHSLEIEKILPDVFDEYYDAPQMMDPEIQKLRAKQINEQVMIDYPFSVVDGRTFTHHDFQYKEAQPIPVLMGADYSQYFSVGDIINVQYFAIPTSIEVIGFIHPDVYFPFNHIFQYENKSVIMPMLHFPEIVNDKDDDLLKRRSYLQYVHGIFSLENNQDFADLFRHVNSTKDQYQMFDVIFMELDLQQAQLLGLSANNQIHIIRAICLLSFMLSFVIVFISSVSLQKINQRRYAVLYLCGASRWNIVSYILGQQLFIVFIAFALYFTLLKVGITGEDGTPNMWIILLTLFFDTIITIFSLKDMYGKEALFITKDGNDYGK